MLNNPGSNYAVQRLGKRCEQCSVAICVEIALMAASARSDAPVKPPRERSIMSIRVLERRANRAAASWGLIKYHGGLYVMDLINSRVWVWFLVGRSSEFVFIIACSKESFFFVRARDRVCGQCGIQMKSWPVFELCDRRASALWLRPPSLRSKFMCLMNEYAFC